MSNKIILKNNLIMMIYYLKMVKNQKGEDKKKFKNKNQNHQAKKCWPVIFFLFLNYSKLVSGKIFETFE